MLLLFQIFRLLRGVEDFEIQEASVSLPKFFPGQSAAVLVEGVVVDQEIQRMYTLVDILRKRGSTELSDQQRLASISVLETLIFSDLEVYCDPVQGLYSPKIISGWGVCLLPSHGTALRSG